MSLIRMIGFESGNKSEFDVIGGNHALITSNKRSGNYAWQVQNLQGDCGFYIPALAEAYMQFAAYNSLADDHCFFKINGASGTLYSLGYLQGKLVLIVGYGPTVTGQTVVAIGTHTFQANTWSVIEIHYKLADVDGVLEVRLDGASDILITGDTKPGADATFNGLFWELGDSTNHNLPIDDIVVCDAAGSKNNSWINGAKIVRCNPISDIGPNAWQVSSGSDHYAVIAEVPANAEDFLKAEAIDLVEKFGLEQVPLDMGMIKAVNVNFIASKGAIGSPPEKIAPILTVADTDYQQDDVDLGSDLAMRHVALDLCPDGGNWDTAKINGMKLAFKSRT